ncbi:MAG: hypothetical protein RMA76_01205 [Deltaproteobacteria bacterium]|jgi:hypothetical protein
MVQAPKLQTPISMGGTATLSRQREGWLWNIAKRALPEGSSDADVLHYMRFLAAKNGLELDANNNLANTAANRARMNKPIQVAKYEAPTKEAFSKGARLYPGMSGPVVTALKKQLQQVDPKLKLPEGDVYDAATKDALQAELQKRGVRVRRDGAVRFDATSKIASTPTDTVERKTTPADKAPKVEEKPANRNATINTLETNAEFAKLDPRKQRLVRRSMQNAPEDAQKRIADVASQPTFARLQTGYQQKVLDLAKAEDAAANALAEKMVKSDEFVQADGNVKSQIAELLEQDPRFAADVSKVLDISNEDVVEERDAQLEALAKLAIGGPTAEREPKDLAELKKTKRWEKLSPASRKDLEARLPTYEDPKVAAKLAVTDGFDKLYGSEREQVLFLADGAKAPLASVLEQLVASKAFFAASPIARTKLLTDLEKSPKDAAAIWKAFVEGR